MRALLAITRACLKSIENVKEDEIEVLFAFVIYLFF